MSKKMDEIEKQGILWITKKIWKCQMVQTMKEKGTGFEKRLQKMNDTEIKDGREDNETQDNQQNLIDIN